MMSSNREGRFTEGTHRLAESSEAVVRDHPMTATLAAFGLGLGCGVALTLLLADGTTPSDDRGLAQRVGRQVLEALHAIPDTLGYHRR